MKVNSIYEIVKKMASDLGSLYIGTGTDRKNLMEFFEVNNWFGVIPGMRYGIPTVTEYDIKRFNDPLALWLSAYRKPGRDKINLMLRYFSGIYPVTCRLYREFVDYRNNIDEPAAWKLLDYLLSEIDREITEYDESDIEAMIKPLDTETTLVVALMFADFLRTAKHNGKPLTRWAYSFGSRACEERVNSAYGMSNFAVMAYCVFNEDMWSRQDLITKAVRSKKCADLWLFVALHFICALRVGDMKRLPAPDLPFDGGVVLEKVSLGTFEKQEADALVDELIIRLKLKAMKPSKTSAHGNVSDLKLFVPESLKTPLGIIMAISLAHHSEIKPGNGFVSPSYTNLNVIGSFFGRHFTAALDNRQFTSLRCNKSYLQGIDNIAGNDNKPGKPKGYMLAALARSHKGGIGTLAKATDIYLKDARFSGYNPEFIVREMFERGVFSFIPAILLEMYAGKEYITLPIRLQTKLIGEVGLAAHQIEWMTAAADRVLEKSRQAINAVLQNPDNIHESIFFMLQNIASGNAPGRQEGCLCLRTATGLACSFVDRDTCIGCGYEIYTKAAIHTLMKEYSRLCQLKKNALQTDVWRYEKLLEQAILPAVSEMISAVKILYSETDVKDFLDIVERGIEHVDGGV